jgi:hypothetical protein
MWAMTGFIWLRTEKAAGLLQRGNEPSGSIKSGDFVD